MKLITSGNMLCNRLIKCIEKHKFFSFATAWASTGNNFYPIVKKHKAKIKHSVIGVHFYQTHPDVLKDFMNDKCVHFALQPDGVFHPKVYIFWSGNEWDVFVGSANMTSGGLSNNNEATIHISSNEEDDDSLFKQSIQEIKTWYKEYNKKLTQQMLENYIVGYKHHEKNRKNNFKKSNKKHTTLESLILHADWESFYKRCIADENHNIDGRLKILADARALFNEKQFHEMEPLEQKAIAGLCKYKDQDWGWFGSMNRATEFVKQIIARNENYSKALEAIPLSGPVTIQDYKKYIKQFTKAYQEKGDGIGTVTRLLAMKRPDYFVCLNSKNMDSVCNDLGIARLGKNYDRYWGDVVESIIHSPWWNAPCPSKHKKTEYQTWLGRAAMIDAFFYEP